jgi:hypothetical protein
MDIAAHLEFLCQCLTPAAGASERLERRIRSGSIRWREAMHLAGSHLVTPSLADAFRRQGLFDALPEDIREYLDTVRTLNRLRNRAFRDELANVAGILSGIGIEPVALKGAIALLPDPYPGAEDRVIGDLDLLVPSERVREAHAALGQSGYLGAPQDRMLARDREGMHHAQPLLHPGLPVTVELHVRMLRDQRDDTCLRAGMPEPALVSVNGARVRVPDVATRLLHNFLHTHIQDGGNVYFSVNHRQLLEFVRLRDFAGDLDWRVLAERLQPGRRRDLAVYLLLAEYWYGQRYPAELPMPPGSRSVFGLARRIQSSTAWSRTFRPYFLTRRYLPAVLKLPYRLMTPSWFLLKYRALRSGEPL